MAVPEKVASDSDAEELGLCNLLDDGVVRPDYGDRLQMLFDVDDEFLRFGEID